jgi:hypothetical protein
VLNARQINRVFEKRYPGILFISRENILMKKPETVLSHILEVKLIS